MRKVVIAVLCVVGLSPVPASAQNTVATEPVGSMQQCARPTIEMCPKFFETDCRNNADFRKENQNACLEIVLNTAEQNDEACAAFDPSCKPINCEAVAEANPLRRYYCEKGFQNCPVRLRSIEEGFDEVLTQISGSLEPYNDLIELDITTITGEDELCNYTPEDLTELLTRANTDNSNLEDQTDRVKFYRTCSQAAGEFMEGGRPPGISDQLWQGLIARLDGALKSASAKEGEVNSKLEQLQSAPNKLGQLQVVHEIGC